MVDRGDRPGADPGGQRRDDEVHDEAAGLARARALLDVVRRVTVAAITAGRAVASRLAVAAGGRAVASRLAVAAGGRAVASRLAVAAGGRAVAAVAAGRRVAA